MAARVIRTVWLRAIGENAAFDRFSTTRLAEKVNRRAESGRFSFVARALARSDTDQQLRSVRKRFLTEEKLMERRLHQSRELTDVILE
jgi:hypothetical protein